MAKWVYRYTSQTCCPFDVKFARELPNGSPFAARDELGGRDARALARELLGVSHEEFSAAFRGSPVKRAKLRGLKRNAAVVLGNVGTAEDADVLTRALADPEPLVREHAAWALGPIGGRPAAAARTPPDPPPDPHDAALDGAFGREAPAPTSNAERRARPDHVRRASG